MGCVVAFFPPLPSVWVWFFSGFGFVCFCCLLGFFCCGLCVFAVFGVWCSFLVFFSFFFWRLRVVFFGFFFFFCVCLRVGCCTTPFNCSFKRCTSIRFKEFSIAKLDDFSSVGAGCLTPCLTVLQTSSRVNPSYPWPSLRQEIRSMLNFAVHPFPVRRRGMN